MSQRERQELLALGCAIAEIRRERGISLEQLGAAAGVDPRRIAALERGRVNPGYGLLLALADGLGVRPSVFVARAEALSGEDA
jgi:XRE family transcriptional regulator, fatty acid utilization regulator